MVPSDSMPKAARSAAGIASTYWSRSMLVEMLGNM
jgi:hypothetical protein